MMIGRKPKAIEVKLDIVADNLLDHMIDNPNSRQEFAVDLAHLERIRALRRDDKKRLDPNTMLLVAGNIAGILVVVSYERIAVVTSKAMNFILKPH